MRKNNYVGLSKLSPVLTENDPSFVQKRGNFATNVNIIHLARVVSNTDNSSKIKVRITGLDDKLKDVDLPDCLPLIPQFFSGIPDVGELVYIICSNPWEPYYGRFWIGPIYDDDGLNQDYDTVREKL